MANANQAGAVKHVFGIVADPPGAGVGISRSNPLEHPKHLVGIGTFLPVKPAFELARTLNPALRTVGVVWNPGESNSEAFTKQARQVCGELGLNLLEATIENSSAVSEAATSLVARGADALWVGGDVTVMVAIDTVVAAARKGGIPVFSIVPPMVDRGAIFDYGANFYEVGKDTRFDASGHESPLPLRRLSEAALDIAAAGEIVLIIVAETAGLVGAALRKSPAADSPIQAAARFSHPEIRNWISFTGEPAFAGSLAVVAGVVVRTAGSRLAPMLRPMSKNGGLDGHFHAAACRYRPIRKGALDLQATMKSLMEPQSLQGVLHLLHDTRQAGGSGESEFIRGACWIAPIRNQEVTL
ncbi:MAG: hypothetical protein FJW20_16860 [Acidimicrobiia bacterium]|nr:hypothetical protein [Acidimicrobiia bacterium]